jgi:hypothetical protein
LRAVTDCFEGAQLIKIADQILAPVSGADNSNIFL